MLKNTWKLDKIKESVVLLKGNDLQGYPNNVRKKLNRVYQDMWIF